MDCIHPDFFFFLMNILSYYSKENKRKNIYIEKEKEKNKIIALREGTGNSPMALKIAWWSPADRLARA